MNKITFELRPEHIRLAASVNFKPVAYCGDGRPDSLEFLPEIDPKRPFGNSYAAHDVASRLGLLVPDPSSDREGPDMVMTPEAERKAMKMLIEMPVALALILSRQTFEPGTYVIESCCISLPYRAHMYAWFWLDAIRACAGVKDRDGNGLMERALSLCESGHGWNPYAILDVMSDIAGTASPQSPIRAVQGIFRECALEKFRRLHHDAAGTSDDSIIQLLIREGDPSDDEWPFWNEKPGSSKQIDKEA